MICIVGGIVEFLLFVRCIPQHFLSSLLIYLGIRYDNTSMFCSGLLAEFGYEFVELIMIYYMYLVKKQRIHRKVLIQFTLHHCPTILAILPGNILYSNNKYYKDLVFCLLSSPWINITILVITKMLYLKDSFQRKLYYILYFVSGIIFSYTRGIWFPMSFYNFICDCYDNQCSLTNIVMISIYGIFIGIFNLYISNMIFWRLYNIVYPKQAKWKEP